MFVARSPMSGLTGSTFGGLIDLVVGAFCTFSFSRILSIIWDDSHSSSAKLRTFYTLRVSNNHDTFVP